jgi:ribosomal protein L24E
MKQIIFTLCIFFALITVANSSEIYKCVRKDGNIFFTDNPPQDAKCKSTAGDNENPSQQQQTDDKAQKTKQNDENKDDTGQIKKLIKIPRLSYY